MSQIFEFIRDLFRPRSIDAALRPLTNVVKNLDSLREFHDAQASDKLETVNRLEDEITAHEGAAYDAGLLARRVERSFLQPVFPETN